MPLLILPLAVVAVAVGYRLLRRLRLPIEMDLEGVAFSGAVGLWVMAYAVLALGLLRLLYWWAIVGVLVILAALAWRAYPEMDRRLHEGIGGRPGLNPLRPGSRVSAGLWILVLLTVAIATIGPLVPPGPAEWDSLAYHLYAPKVYLSHHRILFIGHMHQTNFPATTEMLYTIGLALGSDRLAKCFHFLTYLLTICALAGAARKFLPEHRPEVTGPLAGLVYASTPVVVWEAGTAYVDVALALYTLLSVLALTAWWQGREHPRRWLALSGMLAGICMGIKMTGGAALLFLIIAVSVAYLLRAKPVDAVAAFAAILAACFVASPWYMKTYVYTRNPVFPFFYRVLDGRYWTQKMAADYRAEQKSHGLHLVAAQVARGGYKPTPLKLKGFPPLEESPMQRGLLEAQIGLTDRIFARGVPPPPIGLLASYFYSTFDPNKFWEVPRAEACLGPVFLAFIPLILLFRRHPRVIWLGLAFVVFWSAIWLTLSQLLRYLMPGLPILALCAGYAAVRLSTLHITMSQVVRTAMALCLSYPLCANLIPAILNFNAATGIDPAARYFYLTGIFESYPVMAIINNRFPRDVLIATYGEPRLYYLDRDAILADEGHNRIFDYDKFQSAADLIDAYHRVGVDLILVNGHYAKSILDGTDRIGRWLKQLQAEKRVRNVLDENGVVLFQVGA